MQGTGLQGYRENVQLLVHQELPQVVRPGTTTSGTTTFGSSL